MSDCHNKVMVCKEQLEAFKADKEAICAWWNYEESCLKTVSTVPETVNRFALMYALGLDYICAEFVHSYADNEDVYSMCVFRTEAICKVDTELNPISSLMGNPVNGKIILTKRTCFVCRKTGKGVNRCTECKYAFYCSVDCQRKHFPEHKIFCKNNGPDYKYDPEFDEKIEEKE